jgi:hypothetical protein
LHEVFAEGLYNGQARRVRDAVEDVAARVGTSPVKLVFRSVLGGAGKKLREAGRLLARKLLRQEVPKPEDERAVATQVLDEVEAEEQKELGSVLDRLRDGLKGIPASYYEQLRNALYEALKRQSEELGKDSLL